MSEEEIEKIEDEFGNIPLLLLDKFYTFIQENYVSKNKINNIIKKLDNLEIRNHNLTAESFAKNILKDLLEENV